MNQEGRPVFLSEEQEEDLKKRQIMVEDAGLSEFDIINPVEIEIQEFAEPVRMTMVLPDPDKEEK